MLDLAHRPQHTSAFPPDLSHHPRLSASLLKGQTCGWCLLICRTGWATSCQRVYVFVCCINHCLQNFLTKHLEHTTQNEWSKHVRFLLFCSRNDLSYLWPGGEKKKNHVCRTCNMPQTLPSIIIQSLCWWSFLSFLKIWGWGTKTVVVHHPPSTGTKRKTSSRSVSL